MFQNLNRVIDQVSKDKGIDRTILVDALESAMLAVAKRKFGEHIDMEAQYNEQLGEIELFQFKTVVNTVEEPEFEIDLDGARKLDPDAEVDDSLGLKLNSAEFGRIAAQTAKQVIISKVREAEREILYTEYVDRKHELITGIVRRFERRNLIVDLGRTEAILPESEQIQKEKYRVGDRIQALIKEVHRAARGYQIVLSRTDSLFLVKLFEIEVPEMYEGIVKLKAAVRDPGERAKIAVYSEDADVDPVGACVGVKGSRVQNIVHELHGEKIDIVTWHPDPAKFVCNAIAPAEVLKVIIDEDDGVMELTVPDDHLSLAIGRRGQNVRLASQLSGWKIDIQSESDAQEKADIAKKDFVVLPKIDEATANLIIKHGITSLETLYDTSDKVISEMLGMSEDTIAKIKDTILNILDERQNAEFQEDETSKSESNETLDMSIDTPTQQTAAPETDTTVEPLDVDNHSAVSETKPPSDAKAGDPIYKD